MSAVAGMVALVYSCKPRSTTKSEYAVSFSNSFHHNTLNVCISPPLNADLHDTIIDNVSQEADIFVGGSGVPITTEAKYYLISRLILQPVWLFDMSIKNNTDLKIPNEQSEATNWGRTDNAMVKKGKVYTNIYKTLHRKLTFEQYESH